jgi:crotonobetainyl-CoA:carnitine CoA-transferase CaiB-like acyl-CoA transferase
MARQLILADASTANQALRLATLYSMPDGNSTDGGRMVSTGSHTGPYSGITVLDLDSDLAGAYASMMLGELGATVVRVDSGRFSGDPRFRLWNRSKRVVALDPRSSADRPNFEEMVKESDVMVRTMTSREAKVVGLTYDDLARINPRAVYCAIPPFGESGPLADTPADDGVVGAHAGIYGDQGGWDSPPVYVHLPIASYGAAFLALSAIGAALFSRAATGRGQAVEASLYAGALAMQAGTIVVGPNVRSWVRDAMGQLGANPLYQLYECSDGEWVMIACGTDTFWNKLCIAFEKFEWTEDPRFETAPWNIEPQHRLALRDMVAEVVATGTGEHWMEVLGDNDVPRDLVRKREDFFDDPQAAASKIFHKEFDEFLGDVTWMAPPVSVLGAPVPLTASDREPSDGESAPVAPLAGVRVVDLTGYIAGSYGTSLLADLGADVIKVESPMGDGFRMLGGSFQAWNRGKRGMVVDLRTPEGREIVYDLVRGADVVAENFRPGTAEKLGVDAGTLRGLRPSIVYLSVTGYGPTGPLAADPAFDPLVQTLSGAMSAQGTAGRPVYLRVAVADYAAAMLGCFGAVSGLLARRRGAGGSRVQTSLLHAAVAVQAGELMRYEGGLKDPRRWGQLGVSATYRLYEAKDGYLFLSCSDDSGFAAACGALGLATLVAKFADRPGRKKGDEEIAEALAAAIAGLPVAEAEASLRANGVKCAIVRHMMDVHDDPQALANGLSVAAETIVGPVKQMGPPFLFSATPIEAQRPGPGLGQHTDEVLAELGYSAERIAALRAAGAVL